MRKGPIYTKDLQESLDRLARTPDGHGLYLFLQKVLCSVHAGPTTEWALQTHHGKRMFAAELMSLMSKGIEESDGQFGNRAIVFSVSGERAASGRPAGARRLVDEHTRVAGWNDGPGTE